MSILFFKYHNIRMKLVFFHPIYRWGNCHINHLLDKTEQETSVARLHTEVVISITLNCPSIPTEGNYNSLHWLKSVHNLYPASLFSLISCCLSQNTTLCLGENTSPLSIKEGKKSLRTPFSYHDICLPGHHTPSPLLS